MANDIERLKKILEEKKAKEKFLKEEKKNRLWMG